MGKAVTEREVKDRASSVGRKDNKERWLCMRRDVKTESETATKP